MVFSCRQFAIPTGIIRVFLAVLILPNLCLGREVAREEVLESIERAKACLLQLQHPDGSWGLDRGPSPQSIAVTSFTLHALLNAGLPATEPPIQKGLSWLRQQEPTRTNDVALMIEALAAARDGDQDRIKSLVELLESGHTIGANDGSWSFLEEDPNQPSKAHYAAVALYEAQKLGIPIRTETWQKARDHWVNRQHADGGWGPNGSDYSRGGVTAAGIAYVTTTECLLRMARPDLNAAGDIDCCGDVQPDIVVQRGCRWIGKHFAVNHNPSEDPVPNGLSGHFYYLFSLERVGRLTGRRCFVDKAGAHRDWYREGARFLLDHQNPRTGGWEGLATSQEGAPVIATGYALTFLARGLAPPLLAKLHHGEADADGTNSFALSSDSNRHPDDARNFTEYLSLRSHWPRQMTWQSIDLQEATVSDLLDVPILLLHGTEVPAFNPHEVQTLKTYIEQGGFLLAIRGCGSDAFEPGLRHLLEQMYPEGAPLEKLGVSHPVYRSEFLLLDEQTGDPVIPLRGVDVGCRLGIIYCEADLSCLWEKWAPFEIPGRTEEAQQQIDQAMQVGANIAAYATGRRLVKELRDLRIESSPATPGQERRRLLQVAQLRHSGEWDAAPHALNALLATLNRTFGELVSPKRLAVELTDAELFDHPLLYMHGREGFSLGPHEQRFLRVYLERGGLLFADACCHAATFDESFRRQMREIFPDDPLERIPVDHELFSARIGFDLNRVRQQRLNENFLDSKIVEEPMYIETTEEPFLEGIQVDGRYVVIYSLQDISCALERQAPVPCEGFVHEDAMKIALNIVMYALLQ